MGFPGVTGVESACQRRLYPGEGNDNTLQYSCWGNSTDRGAWWVTVHGVAKSWTQLSDKDRLDKYNTVSSE